MTVPIVVDVTAVIVGVAIVEDVTAVIVRDAIVIVIATASPTVPVKNVLMGVLNYAAAANWIVVTAPVTVTVVNTRVSHAGIPCVLGPAGTSGQKIAVQIPVVILKGTGIGMILNFRRTLNQPALLHMML